MQSYKLLLLTLLFSTLLNAQLPTTASYEELQTINKSGSFSLDGNIMIVGAKDEDIGAETGAGAVYIYKRDAATGLFSQIARLIASDALTADQFGRAVAVNGDTIVVSSLGRYYNFGSTADAGVYIFTKNSDTGNYEQIQKITDEGEYKDQLFAGSIEISEDTLIVGGSSKLNIYKRDNSTELFNKMEIPIYTGGGHSFDIDNNIIAVSMANRGPSGDEWPYLGDVEMYELNVNTGFFDKTATLTPSDAIDGDRFGTCISISGTTIAVGLANDFYNTYTSNALYIFQYNSNTGNYDQTDKLTTGSSSSSNDQLGKSVDLKENKLITGGTDVNSYGAAYIFERSNSTEPFKQITIIENIVSPSYRDNVAINNETAIVGTQTALYIYKNAFVECTGDRVKQGTTTCIPGDPVSSPGIWIPSPCGDEYRQTQGTTDTCKLAVVVDPPGIYLPSPNCPAGWKPIQGTSDDCVEPL